MQNHGSTATRAAGQPFPARVFDLTTVCQPAGEQGHLAARMLLTMIRTGSAPETELTRLRPGLIVRNTTATPRAR
jgi:DNA-binding LacI/PurR family transcriptional regulator